MEPSKRVLQHKEVGRKEKHEISPHLCNEQDENLGLGTAIPRGNLIKSTFYNSSQQLSPMSARHMMLRDKIHGKKLERGRKPLRSSLSGRLNEPLIEYVEDSPDMEAGRGHRKGSAHSTMMKSSSFDSGVSPAHFHVCTQRRSRSLDESTRQSAASHSGDDKEGIDLGHDDEFTDEEEDKNQEKGMKKMPQHPAVVSQCSVQQIKMGDEEEPTETGHEDVFTDEEKVKTPEIPARKTFQCSSVGSPRSLVGTVSCTDDLMEKENVVGSQQSLAESAVPEHDSETSSRLGSFEELSPSQLPISQRHHQYYDESEELGAVSSGKASECSLLQDSDDEDMERVLRSLRQENRQTLPIQRTNSLRENDKSTNKKHVTLRRSCSALPIHAVSAAPENREVLPRHASAPLLQAKPPSGKSTKAGLLKIFRRQSWTGHSTSQREDSGKKDKEEDTRPQQKTPLLAIRKKIRSSASSITKLFTRQTSKEDKEEKRGRGMNSCNAQRFLTPN